MKNSLLTTLALGAALLHPAASAETKAAPPVSPCGMAVSYGADGSIEGFELEYLIPGYQLSWKGYPINGTLNPDILIATDGKGESRRGAFRDASYSSDNFDVRQRAFFTKLSPDAGHVDVRGNMRLETRSAVIKLDPVTFNPETTTDITLGHWKFTVLYKKDWEDAPCGTVVLTTKGDAPDLIRWEREGGVQNIYPVEYTAHCTCGIPWHYTEFTWSLEPKDSKDVTVRVHTSVYPQVVDAPLDCRVSVRPSVTASFPREEEVEAALQAPVLSGLEVSRSEDRTITEHAKYTIRPKGEGVGFIPSRPMFLDIGNEGSKEAPPQEKPDVWVYDTCELRADATKDEVMDILGTAEIEVRVVSPAVCDGKIDLDDDVMVHIGKLGEPLTVPMVADGKRHTTEVAGGKFTYTLSAKKDKDGWHELEYEWLSPMDGDTGLYITHSAYSRGLDGCSGGGLGHNYMSSHSYSERVMIDESPLAARASFLLLPYTESKYITIPVHVSGTPRLPFSQIPE